MEEGTIKETIKEVLKNKLNKEITDPDENFFGRNLSIRPIDMVCLFLEFEHIFHIKINDSLMERLPCITLNYLTEAIAASMESVRPEGRLL